jgi:hypothetical protein
MDADIERICKECPTCHLAKVRRQKLQADFDAQAPQAHATCNTHLANITVLTFMAFRVVKS